VSGHPSTRPLLSLDVLREHVAIDPSSPSRLRWLRRACGRRVGGVAGCLDKDPPSSWVVTICGHRMLVHRVVWALATGADPVGNNIDHIDGDATNNDPDNLRVCNQQQNLSNARARSGRTSAYKGVSLHSARTRRAGWKRWAAHFGSGAAKFLGLYATEREAAVAYNRAAFASRGQFSRLNDLDRPGETIPATDITTNEMRARVGLPLESE